MGDTIHNTDLICLIELETSVSLTKRGQSFQTVVSEFYYYDWLVFSSGCESHQVVSICLADNCRGEHGSPGSPGSPGSQGSQGAAPTANTFQYSRASFHTTHIKPKLYKSEKKWPLPWSLTMREVTIIILFVTIVVRGTWGRSWQLNPSLILTCC